MRITILVTIILSMFLSHQALAQKVVFEDSFNDNKSDAVIPKGWQKYGSNKDGNSIALIVEKNNKAVFIQDISKKTEIGLKKTFQAEANKYYIAKLKVKKYKDKPSYGLLIQIRFLPSNQKIQKHLHPQNVDEYNEISLCTKSPEGTKSVRIYIYTWSAPIPQIFIDDFVLLKSDNPM